MPFISSVLFWFISGLSLNYKALLWKKQVPTWSYQASIILCLLLNLVYSLSSTFPFFSIEATSLTCLARLACGYAFHFYRVGGLDQS